MTIIQQLLDFIDAAKRSRNYSSIGATNRKSPIRLIEKELNDQELQSIDALKNNLDKIFDELYRKNTSRISASSIEVYKKRLKSTIADYQNYGSDPSKMASWKREPTTREKQERNDPKKLSRENSDLAGSKENVPLGLQELRRFEFPLRQDSDASAVLFIPKDFNSKDKQKLIKYLNVYLELKNTDGGVA